MVKYNLDYNSLYPRSLDWRGGGEGLEPPGSWPPGEEEPRVAPVGGVGEQGLARPRPLSWILQLGQFMPSGKRGNQAVSKKNKIYTTRMGKRTDKLYSFGLGKRANKLYITRAGKRANKLYITRAGKRANKLFATRAGKRASERNNAHLNKQA